MDLPYWSSLITQYPNKDAGLVFKEIGGKVELNYDIGVFNNACATRVSKALNGSGGVHLVPFFKDKSPNGKIEPQVTSGKNKKWYIFRVRMLVKHLKSRYGNPQEFKPIKFKKELKDKKGIIVYEVPGWNDATGHADLWDGNRTVYKDYAGQATKILFWEAKNEPKK